MKQIKVFIVDDHEIVRDGIKAILMFSQEIKIVGEAADSSDLFKALKTNLPDIVLLDIALPGLSGIEIAGKLRKEYPRVKIIMLTAAPSQLDIVNAVELGIEGFILKDAGRETLLQAIKKVNAGENYFSDHITRVAVNEMLDKKRNKPVKNSSFSFSKREMEIIKCIAQGLSHKQMAASLNISKRTADTHVNNIMRKSGFHSKADIIKYAIANEIIKL